MKKFKIKYVIFLILILIQISFGYNTTATTTSSDQLVIEEKEGGIGTDGGGEIGLCNDNIGCGKDASRLVLAFLSMIFLSMLVIYFIVKINLHFIPESLVVVTYGIVIGLVVKYMNIETLSHLASYNPNDFFLFILPFIIFEVGFTLPKYDFFKNFKAIIILATIGTMIAFLGTALGLYFLGKSGVSPILTIRDSLLLSSISCATDPVATLGIFKALDVEPTLYMIVLGESILNDAVSVILYEAVLTTTSLSGIWKPILLFLMVSISSVAVGIAVALALALLLKYIDFGSFPALETIFILIFSYSSYLIADSIYLSGILSAFFCGMTANQYVYKSLSNETKQSVSQLFRMTSFIGETIVFIYIGMVIPNHKYDFNIKLLVWTVLLLLVTRALSIFPTFFILNRLSKTNSDRVSMAIQFIICVSGLRGAISFSLMAEPEIDETSSVASLLKTDILLVVFATLFIYGSLTYPLLKLLKIKLNSADQTLESINRTLNFENSRFHFVGSRFIKVDRILLNFFSRESPPVKFINHNEMDDDNINDGGNDNGSSGDCDDDNGSSDRDSKLNHLECSIGDSNSNSSYDDYNDDSGKFNSPSGSKDDRKSLIEHHQSSMSSHSSKSHLPSISEPTSTLFRNNSSNSVSNTTTTTTGSPFHQLIKSSSSSNLQ